jgi:hypothetical protein
MRSPSALLLGADARQTVWDCELADRRVAVARWRGTDKAPGESKGAAAACAGAHQRRNIVAAGRQLTDARD